MLDEDRRRAVSDEAVRLYRQEPDLFKAASKEYAGILCCKRSNEDLMSLDYCNFTKSYIRTL